MPVSIRIMVKNGPIRLACWNCKLHNGGFALFCDPLMAGTSFRQDWIKYLNIDARMGYNTATDSLLKKGVWL
jgi:hypothetical protein